MEVNMAENNTVAENMMEEKAKVCTELKWICDFIQFGFASTVFFRKATRLEIFVVTHFLNLLRIGSHKGHHKGHYKGGEYEGGSYSSPYQQAPSYSPDVNGYQGYGGRGSAGHAPAPAILSSSYGKSPYAGGDYWK